MVGILSGVNFVSVILIAIFLIPLIIGAAGAFSRQTVRGSIGSLLESAEFILGLILSAYITKRIFFIHDASIFTRIYDILPGKVKDIFFGQDMLVYIIAVPFFLLIVMVLLRLMTGPIFNYLLLPLADMIYAAVNSMGSFVKRVTGALWQLPKAFLLTVVFTLLLNFTMYYVYSPALADWTKSSREYQLIYDRILYPVLNSNLAKKIPVIIRDSFSNDPYGSEEGPDASGNALRQPASGRFRIIEYFNGVTLDEAVKSDKQIDETAEKAVSGATDEKSKAYLLYKWICRNLKYDYSKAELVARGDTHEPSGSIVAFDTKKGICLDYSSLYVSMCRAAGLRVRLVIGLGYSGVAWGDHAWNQVWYSVEDRWINVDTTFGSTGVNYFDKRDFKVDHRDAEVQGEW